MTKTASEAASEQDRRIARLEAIVAAQALLGELDFDIDAFTDRVVERVVAITGAEAATVEVIEGDEMVVRAASADLADLYLGFRLPLGASLSGACARERRTMVCADCRTDPRVHPPFREQGRVRTEAGGALLSMICAPLIHDGEVYGALKALAGPADAFTGDDVEMLELLARALSARLARQLAYDAMVTETRIRRQLERSLRASEARANHVIAEAGHAIVTLSSDGRVTGWNPAAEATFGWTAAETAGQVLADLIIPQSRREEFQGGLLRFAETGESKLLRQRVELDAVRKDDARIQIEMLLNAALESAGWRFTLMMQDITERRAQAEQFEVVFQNAPIGLALAGLDGRLLKVNDALNAMLGYAGDELLGRLFDSITHPGDLQHSGAMIGPMLHGAVSSVRLEKRYLHKDGRPVWASITSSLVRDAEGAPTRCIAQIEDVTGRRETEARYQLMADNVTDIILTADMDGKVTFISSACSRTLGRTPEEMIGLTPQECFPGEDISLLKEAIGRAAKGEIGVRARWRCRHGLTGAEVWLESKPSVIVAEGKPVAFTDVIRDITDLIAQEQALAQAREDREAQAKLFEAAYSNAPIGLVLAGLDGRLIKVNQAFSDMLGYAGEELLEQTFQSISHPDDLEASAALGRALRDGQCASTRLEKRYIHKSGHSVWVHVTSSLAHAADGTPKHFVSQVEDLTEHKSQAEQIEVAFSHAPIGKVLSDRNGRVLKINAALTAMMGYTVEDMQTRNFLDVGHPDDRERTLEAYGRLLRGEVSSYQLEKRYICKDGRMIWARLTASMVRDANDEPVLIIGQIEDLTGRREVEARYRLMAENATDMIIASDLEGRVTFISPGCRTVLGCESEVMMGSKAGTLIHPDDVPVLQAALKRAAGGESNNRVRWRANRFDTGADVWLESNPSPIMEHGRPVAVVDVVRDVTVQVAQEQALTEARQAAEQATEAKSAFLANMSHEIRTPLTAVIGFNKLLLESPTLPQADPGLAARAGSAGRSLLALINDILDYSKIEAGQLELAMRPASPRQVAEEALALFEPQAWEKGLELVLSVSDAVPQSAVFDAGRLRQVLLNLLGNALKFTDQGRILVRLDYRLNRLLFEVQDTGCGLDAAQEGQLFQRFFQADTSIARRHGGTGLGLAICKALVEVMGGSIEVVSQPGQGATFRFNIMAQPAAGFSRLSDGVEPEMVSLSGVRVLVVDDNPLNLELADAMLSGAGAEVSLAADGPAGLAAADRRPFDAVLLDIRMPGIDGCEVLERLRAGDGPNRTTPVLAFCADGDIGPYRQARFDGFVRKPIDTAELLRSIADAV